MDNKWNTPIIIIAGALLVVTSVTLGVNSAVKSSLSPIVGLLEEVVARQNELKAKPAEGSSADMKAVLSRLSELESEMKFMKARAVLADDNQDGPGEAAGPAPVYDIQADGTPIFGKADAPVMITVFNDFQCPYCSRFHPAVMQAVKAVPDKVAFMIKHYPLGFHPNARPAAKAAMAAGVQGKFYEMSDLLFQNASGLTEDKFKELAGQLGLNVDQFMKDLKERDAEWEKKLQADMALAEKVGVRGTPSYYLNGQATMARSPEQWKAAIEAVLNGAQK